MPFLRAHLPAIFYPPTLLLLFLLAALVWRRWRRGWIIAGFMVLVLSGYGMIPNWLHNSLARRYPVVQDVGGDARRVDIVVLAAGAVSEDESLPITARVGGEWLNRFTEGVRLYRLMPQSRLWVSLCGTDDAVVAHRQLAELAVVFELDADRLRPLLDARITADEARLAREALDPAQPFYLVTSDYHIPRAMLLFRQAGLKPMAAPAVSEPNLASRTRRRLHIWPRTRNLARMERALREYMGMAWAKTVGRWAGGRRGVACGRLAVGGGQLAVAGGRLGVACGAVEL